jgi:hypothetical protein
MDRRNLEPWNDVTSAAAHWPPETMLRSAWRIRVARGLIVIAEKSPFSGASP